jgi:hypothetical protein
VRKWFRAQNDWLVILDNLEDIQVLDELALAGIGAILITTRLQSLGPIHATVDVTPLSTCDGAAFLLRRGRIIGPDEDLAAASSDDRLAAQALTERLGGLPLALDQAGAYLDETACGLDTYQLRFESQHQTLLARRGRLVLAHPESVAATLGLAWKRIATASPVAGQVLALCAFLHPDMIPEELLIAGLSGPGNGDGAAARSLLQLDEAIADLATLSLVGRNSRTHSLTIHRLVQEVVRFTMDPDEQAHWAGRAVGIVADALPGSELYHFGAFARWVPHALAAVDLVTTWDLRTAEASRLLDFVGVYYRVAGQYPARRNRWREGHRFLGTPGI